MASLIYHAGALGDFITTLPAIARWREDRPAERHILLGKPAHAALAPPFDETWDTEAAVFAPLFAGSAASGSPLAENIGSVTSALLFAVPSSPLAATIERLGARGIVRQDPFPAAIVHIVDYHLSLFSPEDPAKPPVPRIHFSAAPEAEDFRETVAIHPGSGSAQKNWPRGRFIDLAARLADRGSKICWIVGPAEAEIDPLPGGDHWRCLPLAVLAGRLARCALYVGNDSGVTHLAAAVGSPTLALFGGSDSRVWAPRGPNVEIIDSFPRGVEAIETRDVLRACLDFLKEK
jgi:ADP-heptose:LPS heptosyltransferase